MENRYHCVICKTKRYKRKLEKVYGSWVCNIDNVVKGGYIKSVPILHNNTELFVSSCAYTILGQKQAQINKATNEYGKIMMDLIRIGRFEV